MTSISMSRGQRSPSCSTTGLPSAFDVESLTKDSGTLHIPQSLPPPMPAAGHRPTNALPERYQRRRGSSYLRHAWHQCKSWSWTSPDGEATAVVAEEAAAPLGSVHDNHEPESENSQQQKQPQQKQPREQGSDSGMGWTTRRGKRRGSCRCWRYVVRFKILGRVCLVVIVAASTFNLYLSCLSTRVGGVSFKRAGLLSAVNELLFSSSRQATKDAGGIIFPEGFPAPRARMESSPGGSSYAHDGSIGDPRRSIWDRVAEGGNALVFDQNGASETGTKRGAPSVGKTFGISQLAGKEPTTAGAQHNDRPYAAVEATEQVLVPRDEFSILEGSTRVANIIQTPLQSDPFDGQRVAVVVPYIGRDLPVWWDAFAEQARFNDGLIDWIVFCDEKLVKKNSPPNIKFFPMTTRRLAWLLAGVVEPDESKHRHHGPVGDGGRDSAPMHMNPRPGDKEEEGDGLEIEEATVDGGEGSRMEHDTVAQATEGEALTKNLATRKRAASFLHQLLLTSPYFIVEFKPALGWLFRAYLSEYSHWAFGDLDVLFGDMRKGWLEPNELKDFDIITFSFGDQYRAYLRGQLTIHKNRFNVNRVWRRCSYLTNYSERLETFRVNHGLSLESAEGCYSRAAASDPSLRIKFTVKALSDVDQEDEEAAASTGRRSGREVIVDGNGLVTQCPDLGYYDRPLGAGRLGGSYGVAPGLSPAANGSVVPLPMQDAVGPMTAVEADTSDWKCEHWIRPEHQTCVRNIGSMHTLFLIGGEYFKQEFINTAAATGGGDCRAGAFYHFQEHKRNYRAWNTSPPVQPAHFGIAAGPGGIVPIPAGGWRESVSGPGLQPQKEHAERVKNYCLGWTERRQPRALDSARPEQVCAVKVSSEDAVTVVDTRQVPGLQAKGLPPVDVTLGSVGGPGDLELFMDNAAEWEGPKIFAMALDAGELAATTELEVLKGVKYIRGGILIVVLLRPPQFPGTPKIASAFPRKALMNLVTDRCDSRYLLSLPGGSRLSPRAFQAVTTQLRIISRRNPPLSRRDTQSPPGSKNAGRGRGPQTRISKITGPVTLVLPFDTANEALPFRDSSHTIASTGSAGAAALDAGIIGNGNNVAGTPGGSLDAVSATAATAAAAEEAARETGLALEHARVALAAAVAVEAAAARAAAAAEGIVAAVQAAKDESAAAAAAEWSSWSRGGDSIRNGSGSRRSSEDNSNSRSEFQPFSGGGGIGVQPRVSRLVEAPVESTAVGGTNRLTGPIGGGRVTGLPLHISFLSPKFARPKPGLLPATSYGDSGSATTSTGDLGMATSQYNSPSHGHRVDPPRSAAVTQNQPPIPLLDDPPAERPHQQKQPGNDGVIGRGGWLGGDGPISSSVSVRAPASLTLSAGKLRSARAIRSRRLAFFSSDKARGAAETAARGRTSESESESEGQSDPTVAEAKTATAEEQETEWIRNLLFSVPGMPGLVVDLWSPGPAFLRHVEEFGDAGCMDAAYALGLWRAGSSFEVIQGATLTSTALSPSPLQHDEYRLDRRAFTSEKEENNFRVPGGSCLGNEAVADTASIYSAFLLQVANVYQHPFGQE